MKVKDYEHKLKLKKQHKIHYCKVMGPAMRTPSTSGLEVSYNLGPDFDMSSFFPCKIDDAIQYIILGYGAQAPKIVIL